MENKVSKNKNLKEPAQMRPRPNPMKNSTNINILFDILVRIGICVKNNTEIRIDYDKVAKLKELLK